MSLIDHRAAMYFGISQLENRDPCNDSMTTAYTYIEPITPYAMRVFGRAEILLQRRAKDIKSGDIPPYTTVLYIKIDPRETLGARAGAYWNFWHPKLYEVYEEIYDGEAALSEEIDRINMRQKRGPKIQSWKSRLRETPEDRKKFVQFMKDAMKALPGAAGAKFGVLTPELAYDHDCNGLFEPPPSDTIYVPLSCYLAGEMRTVPELLEILSHEVAHREMGSPGDHSFGFRLKEETNRKALARMFPYQPDKPDLKKPGKPPQKKPFWRW